MTRRSRLNRLTRRSNECGGSENGPVSKGNPKPSVEQLSEQRIDLGELRKRRPKTFGRRLVKFEIGLTYVVRPPIL